MRVPSSAPGAALGFARVTCGYANKIQNNHIAWGKLTWGLQCKPIYATRAETDTNWSWFKNKSRSLDVWRTCSCPLSAIHMRCKDCPMILAIAVAAWTRKHNTTHLPWSRCRSRAILILHVGLVLLLLTIDKPRKDWVAPTRSHLQLWRQGKLSSTAFHHSQKTRLCV